MSGIFLSGMGAVSPAGWGMANLSRAQSPSGMPVPQLLQRPGWAHPLSVLRVPTTHQRPAWVAHPRMRRSALISQFAMSAAIEALGDHTHGSLGIVFCTMCGCVNYSRRFFDEVLRNPTVASPLLFPETVFNAPASHLSALLGSTAANYTLVGDAGVFLHGLALAAGWLANGRVERCLVIAAEEADWVVADALRYFRKSAILAEGAGAVLLTRESGANTCAELECVTDPEPFADQADKSARTAALQRVVVALPPGLAAIEEVTQFSEAFSVGPVWRLLAAIRLAQQNRHGRVTVAVPGAYQEAIGASFLILLPNTK